MNAAAWRASGTRIKHCGPRRRSKMRLLVPLLVVGAAVVAVACGLLAPLWQQYRIRAAEHNERVGFAQNDAVTLVSKYPLLFGAFVQQNAYAIVEGPASQAWESSSIPTTARAVVYWITTNFFVRALSPQSFVDCAATAALLVFVLAVILLVGVVAVIGANVWTNMQFARTFAKQTSRASLAAPEVDIVDE